MRAASSGKRGMRPGGRRALLLIVAYAVRFLAVAAIITVAVFVQKAASEAHLQIEEATRRIREEKEKAIREVRSEIADLSIAIAEKVIKEKINRDNEHKQIIDRLLNEVSFSKS